MSAVSSKPPSWRLPQAGHASLPEAIKADPAPEALLHTPVETRSCEAELDALQMLLANAKRPFVVLGSTRWDEEAVAQMRTIAEDGHCLWQMPESLTSTIRLGLAHSMSSVASFTSSG
ncbi:hypothetical protein P9273_29600 [Mesorhizobium sp. WSM4935]|uniref:hypothetical protein n=1 Tax=Mesorhizobium sp. WSM4935 TaxID=3038547 RepID=UPI0024153D0E|nr:hypothetical protein [Mesorhizobium sp. WSM4935]MDG4879237.1 hypothetical protein [Mesorhizobium sp. WSM4935]